MSVFGPLTTNLVGAATASVPATLGIDARQTRFGLASTSGITGVGSLTTPQSVLVCEGEKMLVQSVPLSGIVEVIRGVDGTKAKPHVGGALVYYGAKTAFGFANADGFIGLIGTGGLPDGSLPDYVLPLGSRRTENGKEYILCDFTATVHSGVVVLISNDGLFTAAPFVGAAGTQGAVGVVVEQTSTSDYWGWVQVYGAVSAQMATGDSAATSAFLAVAASSATSPATGADAIAKSTVDAHFIFGMFITGIATTAVTSASSHTGVAVPVFLNYPYVLGYTSATFSSVSQ